LEDSSAQHQEQYYIIMAPLMSVPPKRKNDCEKKGTGADQAEPLVCADIQDEELVAT
jgi:hypothetical protein